MSNKIPKVINEGRLAVDGLDIKVLTLDNGQRVIPKDDMIKALEFLGMTKEDVELLLKLGGEK